jgi:class 3 adenylate cyclase/tetratricopeptide (TPR) repeat protein
MSIVCPSCGRENPDDARFCSGCATELVAPTPAREERKVVTVLFCDLVGSTARAEGADPEDVRAFLSRYQARVKDELERLGGTVEKFIGDAAMAVFGAPVAHEDDAERAVRAALAIRDWASEGDELQLRIAVNTGEAHVALGARPDQGETMVAGDVINTAARLQAAAPTNGVLVGETTYRATERTIEYREHEPVHAKGKSVPLLVWEAVQARARVEVERVGGAPLVGRDKELSLLREALERALDEREPQLVTLVGMPGIGKSRLVFELFKAIERGTWGLVFWRRGRSLPYGDGVTFWALAEMVKAQGGILESDTAARVRARLRRAVADLGHAGEAQWLERHLRPLVGLAAETELGGDRREEAFGAWRRFFESMAERRPLVLVFEDLHWADEALLDFVDELVDWTAGVPMLVLCTARPELLTRRPGWGVGKPNAVTVSLSPLSDDETAHLVHSLLDRAVLPAETQSALIARAGGNPLYAEEFVRLAQEQGLEGEEITVPESVQAIIAARLDGLDAEDKGLLQNAAVLGRVFWGGALASVSGLERGAVERRLHGLERREFVRRERRPSVAGEKEYAFRHVLVRDVAYSQIPRATRGQKHRDAAEWIETLGRSEDHAEMLAHHYSAALELARVTGEAVAGLDERARVALREAGDRAAALNTFDAAARYYASALELWPRGDPERPQLLLARGRAEYMAREAGADLLEEAASELLAAGHRERVAEAQIMLADLAWSQQHRDLAYRHLERAVALVDTAPVSPTKAEVLSHVSRYHMLGGREEEAISVGEAALAMAEELGLDELRAHALNNVGAARSRRGDPRAVEDLGRSIEIARAINSPECARGYNNLGVQFAEHGDLRRAAETWREGWRVAERFGKSGPFRFLNDQRLAASFWEGRWSEALDLAEAWIAEAEAGAPRYFTRWAYEMRGRIRLSRGDLHGGLADAERSLERGRLGKDPQILFPALSFAAFAHHCADASGAAEALADELLALDPFGHLAANPVSPAFDLAWVLSARGRAPELAEALAAAAKPSPWLDAASAIVAGDLVGAAERYARIGSVPNVAFTRLRAAEKLIAEGRHPEADVQLEKALAFYRTVDATAYIREGEAVLAKTA